MQELSGLINKAVSGNNEALLVLCECIAKKIYFRVMCILDNSMDAEDVAQEVLYRVCDNITGLKEPKVFNVWLGKIITNEINRYVVKKYKHGVLLDIEKHYENLLENDEEFLPSEYVDRKDSHKEIMEIIRRLPERQKQVLMLHYYDGMSVTEIAETMGITKPTVSVALKRARNNIKQKIDSLQDLPGAANQFAMAPLGPLLVQIFSDEALIRQSVSNMWVQQATANCHTYLPHGAVAVKAAVAISQKLLAPLLITAGSAAATVTLSFILISGSAPEPEIVPPPPPPEPVQQISIEEAAGKVLFEGGNAAGEHVNPKTATCYTYSEFGVLTIQSWQITDFGSGSVLYSGEGVVVGNVLSEMQERGENGQYMLRFFATDVIGGKYTIGSSFIISIR